ncbi:MAG: TOPRIM nucleotidyl transferase/hydrolase domain-containing protein [Acidimicrobiales bacterium]
MSFDGEGGRVAPPSRSLRRTVRRRAHIEQLDGYEHGPDATQRATKTALALVDDARSVVLVEGISDQIAVETLAMRMGRKLGEERVVVIPIGGAHAAKHFVPCFAGRADLKLSGLVDRAEAVYFARALAEAGVMDPASETIEGQGFFVCDADLEDELIRSVDEPEMEQLLASEGDLSAFRSLQNQPGWRDKPFHAQMHRWLRSVALRGSRYAQLVVVTADSERLPPPLLDLVHRI